MEHWNARQRSIAEVLWPSFLVAGVGTMLFFSQVDPSDFPGVGFFDFFPGRTAGYTVGFFFFWFLTASASALTTWLIRTERKIEQFPHTHDQPDP